jgi:mRNA interferase MazF
MGVKRGDLAAVALQGAYSKPRPALVIQSNLFAEHPSVTLLPLTSELVDAPLVRIPVEPSAKNGLQKPSQIMVDKTSTLPWTKISEPFGQIEDETMLAVMRALTVFLGFA